MSIQYFIGGGCAAVAPSNPTGGSETCSSLSNSEGKRCTISCTQVDQQPSQPGPYYYTCNKYGMYGMAERVEPFIYPPCAGKSNIYTSLFLPYLCHVSLILLLPNTDHLQQVKDYVRDCSTSTKY